MYLFWQFHTPPYTFLYIRPSADSMSESWKSLRAMMLCLFPPVLNLTTFFLKLPAKENNLK